MLGRLALRLHAYCVVNGNEKTAILVSQVSQIMITQRQFRYFTFYTLAIFGTPLIAMLSGCVTTSPNIRPEKYCAFTDATHCMLDPQYFVDAEERRKLQNKQRWAALVCDFGTTAIGLATGGAAEAFGAASLIVKVPVSAVIHKHAMDEADKGNDLPEKLDNGIHWGACLINAAVIAG